MKFELRYIDPADPLYSAAREVRYECLYSEWNLPRSLVEDTDGRTYEHLVALEGDRVIGYARMHLEEGDAKILQLSVTSAYRGEGVATALMQELVRRARVEGRDEVRLDAREHVIGFYEKLGFASQGEMFLSPRTHTPHILMTRTSEEF